MMVTETLDSSTQAFLKFLTRQLTEHPQLIEPLDTAEMGRIAALVEDVNEEGTHQGWQNP